MCWSFQYAAATGIAAAAPELFNVYAGNVTASGRDAIALATSKGKLSWIASRFGMNVPDALGKNRLCWNARSDRIKDLPVWSQLIRQRCAVPVKAVCENRPHETWLKGETAYLLGLFDTKPGGGFVIITEADGSGPDGRQPVLIDEAGAKAWLAAQPWDAYDVLAKARRVAFEEADLFESKQLSVEARNRTPLPQAA